MKRDHVNYFLAGSLVIIATLLALAGLVRMTGAGGATDRYFTEYPNVSGVRSGTPVLFEGYRIGQVEGVEPIHDAGQTRFRVELSVRRGWPIPADSQAELASSGLLADVLIGIRQGRSSDMLAPGASIPALPGADLFGAFSDLAREAQSLSAQRIGPLVDLVSARLDDLTTDLKDSAPQLVGDARETLERLKSAATAVDTLLGPQNRASIEAILGNLVSTSENAERLSADFDSSREQLDALLVELQGIAADNRPEVQRAIRELRYTMETVSGRIDTITHHLEAASRNVNEFTLEIRRRPNLLLFTPERDQTRAEETR